MSDLVLRRWQTEVLEYLHRSGVKKRVLAMDTGTGKTVVGLTLIRMFEPERALIVTPAILVENAWLLDNERFQPFRMPIRKLLSQNISDISEPGIFICSYTIFRLFANDIKRYVWDMVILDESHRIGNRGSKVSRLVTGVRKYNQFLNPLRAERMYLLTGTFIPNREEQVYPQLCAAGLDESWTSFSSRFFYHPSSKIRGWVRFNESKRGEFYSLISKYVTVVKRDAAVEGRSKVFEEITFKLPERVMRIQKALCSKGIYRDDILKIMIDYNIQKFGALRQLARGFVYMDDDAMSVSNVPYKVFEEFIQRASHEPYIVFYAYDYERTVLEAILKRMKLPHHTIRGGVAPGARKRRITEFGGWDKGVLLMQYNCGKQGLSFKNCNHMVFFSLIDDAEALTQAQDRIFGMHRGIEGEDSYYYFFLGHGTIDHAILKSLRRKTDMQETMKEWVENERTRLAEKTDKGTE